MSVQATTNVWQNSQARGSALLLVLLAIADYANADGLAWPSLSALAARTRMSERQTLRHLAHLVRMGELSLEPVAADRRRRRYRITISETRTQNPEPPILQTPVIADTLPAPKNLSSMTQIPVTNDRAYKESEPSMNYQIAIAREKNPSSPALVPPELAAFDEELRACPGYDPDARFYAKVLENYASLDLEEQAIRIAGWLKDHTRKKRLCTRGFVLGWLSREAASTALAQKGGATGARRKDLGGAHGLEKFG